MSLGNYIKNMDSLNLCVVDEGLAKTGQVGIMMAELRGDFRKKRVRNQELH